MIPIIVILILSLDQISKTVALRNLPLNNPVEVINNFFYLTLVHNKGAAFGILKGQTGFFILTAFLAVILILLNLKGNSHKQPLIYNISLSLILAGGAGNLIDRLLYGYVVDFIDFRVWPVFNIADSAITIGAALLAYSIFKKPEAGAQKPEKDQ